MAFKNRHSAALDAKAVIQKKRNADCMFFLESPFTCKKANENSRVKWGKQAFTANKRNSKCQAMNKDETNDMYFSGPKSLAELKCSKNSYCGKGQSVTNCSIRPIKLIGHLRSKNSLPFEGPKSLSEILKRKREAASRKINVSTNRVEKDERVGKVLANDSHLIATPEMTNTHVSCSKEEYMDGTKANTELEEHVTNNLSHDVPTVVDCSKLTKYHFTLSENTNAVKLQDVGMIDVFEKTDIDEFVCETFETEYENLMFKDEHLDSEEDDFSTRIASILAS